MITYVSVPTGTEISQRKLETYARYIQVLDWGRKYPIQFAERFMGIELLDFQKYLMLESWTKDFIGWLVCRNGGKTTEAGIYTMLRSLLLPFHATYFLGNTGDQSKEVFLKIEKIAKREIESFTGSTEFFMEEVRPSGTSGDGWSHLPASYKVELFNGASINTLNSDIINIKGKRANLVVFDESGWFPDELFVQAEQFTNQDENFKLGGSIDLTEEPKNFPRQLLYCSSASDTESGFYKKLRSFTMEMLKGNPHYFVCNLDANVVKNATRNGEPYPSLLSEDKILNAMRENPEKGQRELFNHFSSESHEGQILTRRHLMQHTKQYVPEFKNRGDKLYMLSWDSARINDGSIVEAAELINDPEIGWRMELKNVHAFVDPSTKGKMQMRMQDQVAGFQKLLLDYNGSEFGKLDYENITDVLIDAGAAGQPYSICDNLIPDYIGADGNPHKGIIDTSHKMNEAAVHEFPDAKDIVTMVDPRSHRNELYKAIEDMVKLGVVSFPMAYDGKDYYIETKIVKKKNEDGKVYEEEEEIVHNYTDEEQIALMQIELLKTELITMCKYTSGQTITYNFPPDKRNKMHDDRIYAFGLLCWKLAQLRRGQILTKKEDSFDLDNMPVMVSALDYD